MRTVLFVPGDQPRMLAKARSLPADAAILDLEDEVPPGEKGVARAAVRHSLDEGGYRPWLMLRVNGLQSGLAGDDLREAFGPGLGAVCLPKAETAAQVRRLDALLDDLERARGPAPGSVKILLMVETALGVLNAHDLARASGRVRALCLGGEDLARDLGAVRSREGLELAWSRAQMVVAARAAGVVALDGQMIDAPVVARARELLARSSSPGS